MKKSLLLALVAAMSLSVAGTALAQNPFSDVPQGHWAYDAIAQLEKDGLITGYGDGNYYGDRTISRYRMATIIAQLNDANVENTEMINRLRSEFAAELYNLGIRVDKLEKNASTIKFYGDARIRYQKNTGNAYMVPEINSDPCDPDDISTHRFEQRVRINMDAIINEHVKFKGRVNYTNVSNYKDVYYSYSGDSPSSWSRDVWLDRAELQWTRGSFEGRFGRITPILGQGLIWYDNPADGALIGYKTAKWDIFGGVLDYSPTYGENYEGYHGDGSADNSINATVANIGYRFNDNFAMTAAYSNYHDKDGYHPFEFMTVGLNAKLSSKWGLVGEYIKNNADKLFDYYTDDGYWIRTVYGKADMNKKGSYSIYAEYLNLGGGAIDSYTYGHILDVPGTSDYHGGAKGYGIGITYVPAKNMNIQFIFHDLKSKDDDLDFRNSYQFVTNFRF